MITGIEFDKLNENKTLGIYQLTNNTIILFNNSDLKYKFQKEFLKIRDDETDRYDNSICYSTAIDNEKFEEQDHKAEIKIVIEYMPTSIYKIDNEQTIVLTVEAPFIFTCKDPYDLWFCDTNNKDEIQLYSFVEFKDYKELWDKGIDNIYKMTTTGRFGCYEGYGR